MTAWESPLNLELHVCLVSTNKDKMTQTLQIGNMMESHLRNHANTFCKIVSWSLGCIHRRNAYFCGLCNAFKEKHGLGVGQEELMVSNSMIGWTSCHEGQNCCKNHMKTNLWWFFSLCCILQRFGPIRWAQLFLLAALLALGTNKLSAWILAAVFGSKHFICCALNAGKQHYWEALLTPSIFQFMLFSIIIFTYEVEKWANGSKF